MQRSLSFFCREIGHSVPKAFSALFYSISDTLNCKKIQMLSKIMDHFLHLNCLGFVLASYIWTIFGENGHSAKAEA